MYACTCAFLTACANQSRHALEYGNKRSCGCIEEPPEGRGEGGVDVRREK